MRQEPHSIPKRRTSTGTHVETRPIYIEEWLDSLPYIDFNKTSQLLLEATAETNKESIKPEARLELVSLYHRPYQYYLESQIKSGAQHTLQSMETMQEQIAVLKQIAVNLGRACSLSIEENLHRKTIWRQKKSPLPAMLMQMHYLSHALIFSYLEYTPAPENIWRELNGLYYHAENRGQQHTTVIPPGGDPNKDAGTITNTYKSILLSSMVDPYHLPFGAIWEIYIQLRTWSEQARIMAYEQTNDPAGIYVIDLEGDTPPVAFGKFDPATVQGSHRIIRTTELGVLANKSLEQLNAGKGLDKDVRLSAFYAKQILTQMSSAWSLPAVRYSPRVRSEGPIQVTSGMNAIYFYLNGKQEFVEPRTQETEHVITDVGGANEPVTRWSQGYTLDQWEIVDQGPGGFAICKKVKPKVPVKVGDLVGITRDTGGDITGNSLALGAIRWLLVSGDRDYKIGIQTIAAEIIPAAIRAVSGSAVDTRFKRAIIAGDFSDSAENSVITSAGLFKANGEYELIIDGKTLQVRTESLVETTASFNYFTVVPLN